jgi:hypothetical protein
MILKAKTRTEISAEYGISVRTLKRWLKRENLYIPSGLIDPNHLKRIYATFGIPENQKVA